tara:strand:+ start:780 stop:1286 length:507 start_codon:yes stop_codon:yes gene_type:complete
MLSEFTDDLFDVIVKNLKSNELYKLLLVDKDIKNNIKKEPIELRRNELECDILNFNPYGRLAQIYLNLEFLRNHNMPKDCGYVFENINSKFYDIDYHKIIVMNDLYKNLKMDIQDLCNILCILDIKLRDKSLEKQNKILREISGYAITNINKKLIVILNQINKIILEN